MSGSILLFLRILMAVCLYAILGLALYILWQNLKQQTSRVAQKSVPPLTLFQQEDGNTLDYRFTAPEITIGRDPACDCILNDSTVSAMHARLTFRQGQWWIEDLRSTNGTFLNQDIVFAPLVVTSGDQLRCGQVVLSISVSQAGRNGETQPEALS